ncbi:MAG TPA: hypothetical protein VMD78_11660 [Candidatus Baltobacteraceae bacterium]|nr:hypothetical protein [Candidatus Baltobacteraceae bacterium]
MREFIDGIERELRPSCPLKSRTDLGKFRNRLDEKRLRGGQKRFGQELDELLQSDRFLRLATERYFARVVPAAIEAALVAIEQAKVVLAKAKEARRKKPSTFVM